MHEFDKVELFAYATPEAALDAQADILRRAESMLQDLELRYRVLDLCAGDLAARRPAPSTSRCTRPASTAGSRCPRSAGSATTRPAGPTSATGRRAARALQLVHTVNGSALAWPRIWAALVENGRQEDGTVLLPEALAPYVGGELLIKAP